MKVNNSERSNACFIYLFSSKKEKNCAVLGAKLWSGGCWGWCWCFRDSFLPLCPIGDSEGETGRGREREREWEKEGGNLESKGEREKVRGQKAWRELFSHSLYPLFISYSLSLIIYSFLLSSPLSFTSPPLFSLHVTETLNKTSSGRAKTVVQSSCYYASTWFMRPCAPKARASALPRPCFVFMGNCETHAQLLAAVCPELTLSKGTTLPVEGRVSIASTKSNLDGKP